MCNCHKRQSSSRRDVAQGVAVTTEPGLNPGQFLVRYIVDNVPMEQFFLQIFSFIFSLLFPLRSTPIFISMLIEGNLAKPRKRQTNNAPLDMTRHLEASTSTLLLDPWTSYSF